MLKRSINLFVTRTFITTVGVVTMTHLKPALEDYIKSNYLFSVEKHGLPVVYSMSELLYFSWLRHATDDEGESYTPRYILGRDKNYD